MLDLDAVDTVAAGRFGRNGEQLGGMMNTEAIILPEETTLATAMLNLREHENLLENTHVLFLADAAGRGRYRRGTGRAPTPRVWRSPWP